MIAPDDLEPTARLDVLEEEMWRAESDLRALLEAYRGAPRVDSATGVITLASGVRMVEDTGDARRIRDELERLRLAVRRSRAHLAQLRAERRRLGDRWPLGLAEIAAELGYPAATVKQWHWRGVMPAPDGTVSGVAFWWRPTVMAWARECGRDRKVPGLRSVNTWAMAGDRGSFDR